MGRKAKIAVELNGLVSAINCRFVAPESSIFVPVDFEFRVLTLGIKIELFLVARRRQFIAPTKAIVQSDWRLRPPVKRRSLGFLYQ